MSNTLTHLDAQGHARMVDVSDKIITHRESHAQAMVTMKPETLAMIVNGQHAKGDVLAVARVAGIQAAKKTSDLIPLCHPIALTGVKIHFTPNENGELLIDSFCKVDAKTGVEMEALVAASVAALTVYDMCKAVEKMMVISDVKLLEKTGGKSGDWKR